MHTTCNLINRSPLVPLKFDIPERVLAKKDVSYSHLKVFECKAFVHVPKEQRSKFDDKALPCIFMGYGDEEFRYGFCDPMKKKIVRSKDVVFHEDQTIEDSGEEERQPEKVTVELIPPQ